MNLPTDPLFWLAAVIAVTLVGLAKGGFTGVGMVGTPLLALVVPPLQAVAIMLPILLVQDVVSVWAYRRDWDPWNLKVLIPGGLIGVAAGGLLAAYVPDAAVRLAVGVIGVTFVLWRWFGPAGGDIGIRPSAASGVFWGALSGFTSTLANAGAPPWQVHMMPQHLPKLVFAGTATMYFAATNLAKVIPYFALGQFTTDNLWISAALFPLAIATNYLGIWLVRVTPQAMFYKIVYVITFAISLELIRNGLTAFAA
ncbi:sulfite exporter TauE/SafE family protein [Pseudorhodoplanes sp.]|uniref:sulfite exporter TauE/SafE family protein n=1 Tax=Pseudorhodoplanes sp. TaxID=1934341 RepID=UPI002C019838|nr:sulfite exporter TauE/SafE family protein [Pseudorhodoplanes sp.]HWV43031.1 sulfite exporter TauE/SafE family protein [Pseudorhodoplanes sp.]